MKAPKKVRRYAEGTTVEVSTSKAELEELLRKHGATGFYSSWDDETKRSVVGFRLRERYLRFDVSYPTRADVVPTPRMANGWLERALVAEHRRRWRALLLIAKGFV